MAKVRFGFSKAAPEMHPSPDLTVDALARYVAWACGGDSGVSSRSMLMAITGVRFEDRPHVPYDVSDFGRCYRLLLNHAELRPHIGRVVEMFPEWAKLVARWPELERMYETMVATRAGKSEELYAAIRECIE